MKSHMNKSSKTEFVTGESDFLRKSKFAAGSSKKAHVSKYFKIQLMYRYHFFY